MGKCVGERHHRASGTGKVRTGMDGTKQISTKKIVALSCGDAGRAFIYGIIASYLMVFFIPSESTSALPAFIPNAGVVFGIIYGLSIVWDAITDPIVAGWTDRLEHKDGRRIPFMRLAFIPYAVCAVLIFFPPVAGTSAWNAVWVGVFLLLYYAASTLYFIPYSSLQAEVVNDPQKRVFLFSINCGMYVLSSALVYGGFSLVDVLQNAGMEELAAYRLVFVAFAAIGLLLMMVPVLTIKERDYVTSYTRCHEPLWKSLKAAFSYKNFVFMTLAYLIMWVAMTFFNSAQVYYVTTLLGLSKTYVTIIAAITIVLGVASYPLINKLSAKIGKKPLLVFACVAYILQFIAIWFYQAIISVISPAAFAILIGVVTAIPISITNILPAAAFSDLAQYDFICTGQKRTGMFLASKSFILKLSDAVVVSLSSTLITLNSVDGKATVEGVRATAIPALIASIVCLVFYALYDDKGITAKIREYNEKKKAEEKETEISE